MPLRSSQLVALATAGESLVSLLNSQASQVARLLLLRREGHLGEATFLEALSDLYAGQETLTAPASHIFEMTLLRYRLKKKDNERARKRMERLRARGGSPPRPPPIPSPSSLEKEAEYLRLIEEAEASESLGASDEEAIFAPGGFAPFTGKTDE